MLDDFDIVADADNFELIQDVEFYSWLADSGPMAQAGGVSRRCYWWVGCCSGWPRGRPTRSSH